VLGRRVHHHQAVSEGARGRGGALRGAGFASVGQDTLEIGLRVSLLVKLVVWLGDGGL